MRHQQVLTLLFAVCCLLALVSLSSSLESTVSTQPDDALDVDHESLPLPVEEASELKRSFESTPSDEQNADDSASGSTQSADRQSSASRDAKSTSSSSVQKTKSKHEETLLDILRRLLEALLGLLPVLAALGVLAVATSQRTRLMTWLRRRLNRFRSGGAAADTTLEPSVRSPANRVERAWLEMLSRADVDPEPSATPRECAEMLVRTGFDRESVLELTTLFERVRYDDVVVTTDHGERALEHLRRTGGDG